MFYKFNLTKLDIIQLGQPIRLLNAFVEQDFVDKFYDAGPSPDYNLNRWLDEKFKFRFDFPNVRLNRS